jgi:hypothetical protein
MMSLRSTTLLYDGCAEGASFVLSPGTGHLECQKYNFSERRKASQVTIMSDQTSTHFFICQFSGKSGRTSPFSNIPN